MNHKSVRHASSIHPSLPSLRLFATRGPRPRLIPVCLSDCLPVCLTRSDMAVSPSSTASGHSPASRTSTPLLISIPLPFHWPRRVEAWDTGRRRKGDGLMNGFCLALLDGMGCQGLGCLTIYHAVRIPVG
ncbi:hypothetical protein LZ31DRAFT_312220 [Colletotrichum somersetense]|nr:hypothetical protein LZ31DRAFT_312220 [Colletotrichum somersetense]